MPFLCRSTKKWRKKTDFGKPKSQVCLFAKREHRASAGANIARSDVPSEASLRTRKVVPLSLHSIFREGKHLQPLRLQVKETRFRQAEIASLLVRGREHRASHGRKHCCKHGSSTQAEQQTLFPSFTAPQSNKIPNKTILPSSPAARGGKI